MELIKENVVVEHRHSEWPVVSFAEQLPRWKLFRSCGSLSGRSLAGDPWAIRVQPGEQGRRTNAELNTLVVRLFGYSVYML